MIAITPWGDTVWNNAESRPLLTSLVGVSGAAGQWERTSGVTWCRTGSRPRVAKQTGHTRSWSTAQARDRFAAFRKNSRSEEIRFLSSDIYALESENFCTN
ncbi:hypothetical protein AVEN_105997-1 [Araneus ventricosus]|uniref:Uncharacterized protein n=1 Tax=Araneus ventricosus TaxID=182803 RepID=A0A4Y2TPH8_ARAVE|nr:hypothetical protein AVEN_105997-1 [Araneus ventricosus]